VDPQNGQERDMTTAAQAELTPDPDVNAGDAQPCAAVPPAAGAQEPERDPQRGIVAALSAGRYDEALRLCAYYHGETLGRLCMTLVGSPSEAEDLVQDTLLAAYQGLSGYCEQGTVKAWLCSIARRKCARHLEMRSRSRASPATAQEPRDPANTEEQVVMHSLAVRARALLDSIRPSERESLVLRYAAGLTFREVAQACGIEEAAARKRASRALAALRSRLSVEE
jgi:RNA polymerase sigma-70 factor (ECF subfamily)